MVKQNKTGLSKIMKQTSQCRMHEDKPELDAKEAKQFWSKIKEQKEHKRKTG